MVECRCPFSTHSLWAPDNLVPSGYYFQPSAPCSVQLFLTFNQDMDTSSAVATSRFNVTGSGVGSPTPGLVTWQDLRTLVLVWVFESAWSGTVLVDYSEGSNPIKNIFGQEWSAWDDLACDKST